MRAKRRDGVASARFRGSLVMHFIYLSLLYLFIRSIYISLILGKVWFIKAIFLAFKQLNLYFTSLSPTLKKLCFFENDVVLQFCIRVMVQFGAPCAQSLVDSPKLHDCTSTQLHIFHHDFHIMSSCEIIIFKGSQRGQENSFFDFSMIFLSPEEQLKYTPYDPVNIILWSPKTWFSCRIMLGNSMWVISLAFTQ